MDKMRKQKVSKFKDDYVLGEGWPVLGGPYTSISMWDENIYGKDVCLQYPGILDGYDCPKYQLVLRKVRQ